MNKNELVAYIESGCKAQDNLRIGIEHEKIGFRITDLAPIPYDGEDGLANLLKIFAERHGWTENLEEGHLFSIEKAGVIIALEPGGQLELAGVPHTTVHAIRQELDDHLEQLAQLCGEHGVAFLTIALQPKWGLDSIPLIAKKRYLAMRAYLSMIHPAGLDMQSRTASVQVSMDFSNERDMRRKFRIAMALQPLAAALMASSPFFNGKPSGFLSYRTEIWRHTAPIRGGWLPFLFNEPFGFEQYVDYALDLPMVFVCVDGCYYPTNGPSFRQFMQKGHPSWPEHEPSLIDWNLHLKTLFPEVRLKQYLELRGADAGNRELVCALAAFWKGLLYHDDALDAAWELVRHWSLAEREFIHQQTSRLGLSTPLPGGKTWRDLALSILSIAFDSLQRQNSNKNNNESDYLLPLLTITESNTPVASQLLQAYHTQWGQSVDPLFHDRRYRFF